MEVGNSKIKIPANPLPDEGPLPGLQMAVFCIIQNRKGRQALESLIRALTLLMRTSPSWSNYLTRVLPLYTIIFGLLKWHSVKNLPADARDTGSIPGVGNGYPLQYSCLLSSMDR